MYHSRRCAFAASSTARRGGRVWWPHGRRIRGWFTVSPSRYVAPLSVAGILSHSGNLVHIAKTLNQDRKCRPPRRKTGQSLGLIWPLSGQGEMFSQVGPEEASSSSSDTRFLLLDSSIRVPKVTKLKHFSVNRAVLLHEVGFDQRSQSLNPFLLCAFGHQMCDIFRSRTRSCKRHSTCGRYDTCTFGDSLVLGTWLLCSHIFHWTTVAEIRVLFSSFPGVDARK